MQLDWDVCDCWDVWDAVVLFPVELSPTPTLDSNFSLAIFASCTAFLTSPPDLTTPSGVTGATLFATSAFSFETAGATSANALQIEPMMSAELATVFVPTRKMSILCVFTFGCSQAVSSS